jgi:hypothetical protein
MKPTTMLGRAIRTCDDVGAGGPAGAMGEGPRETLYGSQNKASCDLVWPDSVNFLPWTPNFSSL